MFGTNHHEEMVDIPSFPDIFPKIIQSFDQPFSGVVSTYLLSKVLRKHVKVGLTGDGADELFGSYLSHRMAASGNHADEPDWVWRSKLFVFQEEEKRKLYSPDIAQAVKQYDRTLEGIF
jgi:asparagine synthase (glutamine-hydrolysing)